MGHTDNKTGETDVGRRRTGNIARLATLLMAVMALGTIAVVVSRSQTADAYVGVRDGNESRARPAEYSAAEVYVWAGRLTVGESSDASATFLGYVPDAADEANRGSLARKTFHYQNVDHTVLALFHQRTTDGLQQLVLRANHRLPKHLILHTRDGRFPLSEATVMGERSSTHVWTIDEGPGWTRGQTTYVVLSESVGWHIHLSAMTSEMDF